MLTTSITIGSSLATSKSAFFYTLSNSVPDGTRLCIRFCLFTILENYMFSSTLSSYIIFFLVLQWLASHPSRYSLSFSIPSVIGTRLFYNNSVLYSIPPYYIPYYLSLSLSLFHQILDTTLIWSCNFFSFPINYRHSTIPSDFISILVHQRLVFGNSITGYSFSNQPFYLTWSFSNSNINYW